MWYITSLISAAVLCTNIYKKVFFLFRYAAFLNAPTTGLALTAPFSPGSHDTAVGAWRKRWKHWGERCASKRKTTSGDVHSSLFGCREEGGYQQRIAALLAEVSRRWAVLTVMGSDLLCLAEVLEHLYFVIKLFLLSWKVLTWGAHVGSWRTALGLAECWINHYAGIRPHQVLSSSSSMVDSFRSTYSFVCVDAVDFGLLQSNGNTWLQLNPDASVCHLFEWLCL